PLLLLTHDGSLRDVVALTHTPHPVHHEMRTRLAVTGQGLRGVVAHGVDLAFGVRPAAGGAVRPVVRVGVREVDAPVAEAAAERADEGAVDAGVLIGDLPALAPDDVGEHAAGR